jgi:hypothetical protein
MCVCLYNMCVCMCKRMKIQCAELTYHLLMKAPNFTFECEERREGADRGIEVKVSERERERERERENIF